MYVSEIMTSEPITVARNTPLGEAIGLMKQNRCRQLPVVENGHVVGIVTDRDVRLAMNSPLVLHERTADQKMLEETPVETCMTRTPMMVESHTPLVEAIRLLQRYKFGALPVVEDGLLVGIISVSDILDSYIQMIEPPIDSAE